MKVELEAGVDNGGKVAWTTPREEGSISVISRVRHNTAVCAKARSSSGHQGQKTGKGRIAKPIRCESERGTAFKGACALPLVGIY